MRYIYYIAIILFVVSAVIGYELRVVQAPQKNAALIINKKIITKDEFDRQCSALPQYPDAKDNLINSLIIRELLIQESQKEGIDKEETFRRSIQSFYEQSLIKLLMDRKLAALQTSLSEEELTRYLSLWNKKIHLTAFSFGDEEAAKKGEYKNGEKKAAFFEDLSSDVRESILHIEEGGMTKPIRTGPTYVVLRLDRIEHSLSRPPSAEEKERIRQRLTEEKKEKMIDEWITDLRKKAAVKISIGDKN